jgi:hypothetical protein
MRKDSIQQSANEIKAGSARGICLDSTFVVGDSQGSFVTLLLVPNYSLRPRFALVTTSNHSALVMNTLLTVKWSWRSLFEARTSDKLMGEGNKVSALKQLEVWSMASRYFPNCLF